MIAQVLVRREPRGWRITHAADRQVPDSELKEIELATLRDLAQFTDSGAFRPLKSAPNLRAGWRVTIQTVAELGTGLNSLYPGFLADWYAVRSSPVAARSDGGNNPAALPVTHYREFMNRQTGMYRITQHLTDAQAAAAIRACCHPKFCLKQRLWTVRSQHPDSPDAKSLIPCLEPCALMLEFARTVARLEQSSPAASSGDGIQGINANPDEGMGKSSFPVREADFAVPENPRRLQLTLEKIQD